MSDPEGPDDVVIRRRRVASRIELNLEDFGEPGGSSASPSGISAPEPDGRIRVPVPVEMDSASAEPPPAAMLHGERRIPIPPEGLTLGQSSGATSEPAASDIEARIEPTAGGHVVVETGHKTTLLNGERLISGERRPLRRGDTLCVAGEILHYLPAGVAARPLAKVAPLEAGRVKPGARVFTIGRDPSCDLVLDHPHVARTHAVIRFERGIAEIEDRGSETGLRVNGESVKRAQLAVGDQLAIGPFRIVFDGHELVERAAQPGLPVIAEGIQVDVESGTILQPLNLHLRPGTLVGMIGESGAGKTTLLKTLAGVAPPTRGRVLVGGEDVGARASEIGYVPQFDIVHGQLTVREALNFAALLRLPADTSEIERESRVEEIIGVLGLEIRADILIDRLSGGQRKRVAVGVELLHRPGAVFLDEPTTGLDPALERRMMELFRSLANAGQTVVLTTHATGSLALCDRIILMGSGGCLLFDGTPTELLGQFEAEHFDAVYAGIDDHSDRLRASIAPAAPGPAVPPLGRRRAGPPRVIQHDLEYQTRVLGTRYAKLFFRDKRHLKSAFLQIPVLAVLTALLFNSEVFERFDPAFPQRVLYTSQGAQVLFFMVTIAVWLGSINAAREIVKERSVLSRELAVGVQLPAYIASKLIVLLALSAVQTSLFATIVLMLRPSHESILAALSLIAVLIIASWVAVLLGLLVSATARSEDQATAVIPILLVPELLFGGAIVPLAQMTGVMRVVAALVPARWSFAAAGDTIHMQQRINQDPVFSGISRFGQHFFSIPLTGFVLISMLLSAALCGAIGAALQKSYMQ